ncbi:peroxiredoxin [Chelatococcus sp. GCM10030263]|uniref:peroxiredoxin n=1 Tax=Chelatococcus sp. GCM10030263 TaxID=3273387 RepID=UPI003622053E
MQVSSGGKAPDFDLPASGGGRISLHALRGRKVVLYFYPKDDTSSCTREAIGFNRLKEAFASAETEVIGLSADDIASHDRFKAKYKLDLTLASDPSRATIDAYGLWVQKQMFGHKYMGIERATVLIDRDGSIARIWRRVRVTGHPEEVLAAAEAL